MPDLPDAANDDLEPYELIANLVNMLYYDLGSTVSRLSIHSLNKIAKLFMPFTRVATRQQVAELAGRIVAFTKDDFKKGRVRWLARNSSWGDLTKWLQQALNTDTYDPNAVLASISTLRELNAHVEQLFNHKR